MKDSSMQPISSLIENQNGDNLSDILNYHIIKWCKLYLDDACGKLGDAKSRERFLSCVATPYYI